MTTSREAPDHGYRPAIVFSHITKRFSETVLGLDDVSLTVPRSQRVVLLGLSGSGKSTMLRHVNGLQRPTAGTIEVLGRDVGSLTGRGVRELRRNIGFIFQDFHLVGSISALENVCTGVLGSLRGPRLGLWTYSKSCRRQALTQLDRVGLADRAFQRTDTLSGGQQQRVAIARALIQQPSVLLADEPVASLDPESSSQVLELITKIGKEDHLTVLCSLHQLELALGFAERVVGLRGGRVVLDEVANKVSRAEAMTVYGRDGVPDVPADAVRTPTATPVG